MHPPTILGNLFHIHTFFSPKTLSTLLTLEKLRKAWWTLLHKTTTMTCSKGKESTIKLLKMVPDLETRNEVIRIRIKGDN